MGSAYLAEDKGRNNSFKLLGLLFFA